MLTAKISFMNEMANLAKNLGVDIESDHHGIGSDTRIGYQFTYPCCGYGGSCFSKDADDLIVITEWPHFCAPDFEFIKQSLEQSTMFDGRNIYNPASMKPDDFAYISIGRGNVE